EAHGGEEVGGPANVTRGEAVERAEDITEEAFELIEVWINIAMVIVFSQIRDVTARELRRVTEVTYLGVGHGTQAALRRMLPRDRGLIVQVSSALAYRAIPIQSAYCAAKHAVLGFTDALRCALLHDRSHVNVT